jgi:hypothetical protein
MLQWIADNKQWLFSGIGVTLILGIFYLVRRLFNRKTNVLLQSTVAPPPAEQTPLQSIVTPSLAEQTPVAPIRPVIRLDIAAIEKEIESRPPYQRKEVRQNYIGLRFEFTGQLNSADPLDNGQIRIFLQKSPGQYPFVVGEVAENKYPELKVMHQGTKLTVQGTLTEFSSHVVRLNDIVIINYSTVSAFNEASK